MSRNPDLDGWPDCLEEKSLEELERLRDSFEFKAQIYPNIAKLCLKKAHRVEREIARREKGN